MSFLELGEQQNAFYVAVVSPLGAKIDVQSNRTLIRSEENSNEINIRAGQNLNLIVPDSLGRGHYLSYCQLDGDNSFVVLNNRSGQYTYESAPARPDQSNQRVNAINIPLIAGVNILTFQENGIITFKYQEAVEAV